MSALNRILVTFAVSMMIVSIPLWLIAIFIAPGAANPAMGFTLGGFMALVILGVDKFMSRNEQ